MVRNIPGFEDPQQRVLALTLPSPDGDVRVVRAYCPNGQSVGSDKYEYKLAWFEGMRGWPTRSANTRALAVLGDYNVAPADEDAQPGGRPGCWCPNPSATPSAPCSTWA